MVFVKGDIKINRNGRPKGPCIRTKITKQILQDEGNNFAYIISGIGRLAKAGIDNGLRSTTDTWAVDKYVHYLAPYMLLKPKTELDITGGEDMSAITEAIAELPLEKKELVGSLMTKLKEVIYG